MNAASIRKLYDSFENKDMSWENFLAEFQDNTDPKQYQDDLLQILGNRQQMLRQKAAIDKKLGRI